MMLLQKAFSSDTTEMGIDDFKRYLKSAEGQMLKRVIQFHVIDVDRNGMLSYAEAAAMYGDKHADELWKKLRVFPEEEIDIKLYLKAFQ